MFCALNALFKFIIVTRTIFPILVDEQGNKILLIHWRLIICTYFEHYVIELI